MMGVSSIPGRDRLDGHSRLVLIRITARPVGVDMDAVRSLIDDVLELPVAPSFTRIGFSVRRRLFDWPAAESWPMTGRTVVITGATSGLGREAAGSFARMGARLVLVGRDRERLARTQAELVGEHGGGAIDNVVADMSSLASVRAAADEILALAPEIDVLVDNAGAMYPTRQVSADGIEMSLATMVVGPFVLVGRLWPHLAASPDGRIVAVTSGGMYFQGLPLDDLGFERGDYQGARAYARAKRAQVALVREWARRIAGRGIVVNAMHPGWADTPGLEASLPGFRSLVGGLLRSSAEGADTIVWLAAAPEARETTGRLFLDRRVRPFDRLPSTRLSAADRRELWDRVVALSGAPDPTGRSG
jgi:dehydrogenase/reductase SDR family member 12